MAWHCVLYSRNADPGTGFSPALRPRCCPCRSPGLHGSPLGAVSRRCLDGFPILARTGCRPCSRSRPVCSIPASRAGGAHGALRPCGRRRRPWRAGAVAGEQGGMPWPCLPWRRACLACPAAPALPPGISSRLPAQGHAEPVFPQLSVLRHLGSLSKQPTKQSCEAVFRHRRSIHAHQDASRTPP